MTLLEAPQVDTAFHVRPFLKWAGSKFRILGDVLASLPPGERLVEPFVGSGAVFLNAKYPKSLLADANEHLITAFQCIQEDAGKVIAECEKLFVKENNQEEQFYLLREEFNEGAKSAIRRTALFIYLNRHCFNGLCRFNRKGKFNVPFGRYSGPQIPKKEIVEFQIRSRNATFAKQNFLETMEGSKVGDVVYCDPPYVPLSATSSFTAYSTEGFGEKEQRELAAAAQKLASRGIAVVISNHDTPVTRELYASAELRFLSVQRFISCDSTNRGAAPELLAVFR